MNTQFATHHVDIGTMSLTDVVRVLRTLDPKHQERVAGLSGNKILLRCKDQETYERWVKAWKELTE